MASTALLVARASFWGTISLGAIMGNFIVCYVLIKRRQVLLKNRATYQFILNLTLSDLVIVVFLCPFDFTRELFDSWIFGLVLCKIAAFVELSMAGTGVLSHALIAADRYRSLAHPHLPKLKPKRVKQLIALAWIIPAMVSTPYLYMAEVVNEHSRQICMPLAIPMPWLDKLYEAAEFAVLFLSPFCVICWCYYHVISLTVGSTDGAAQIPPAEITLRRSKKRVTKTACLIVGVFVICWTPTFVLNIWRIVSGTQSVHQGHLLYEISKFGGLINEATNPIIYTAYDRNMNICQYLHCGSRVTNDGSDETDVESTSRPIDRNRRTSRNTTRQLRFAESHS